MYYFKPIFLFLICSFVNAFGQNVTSSIEKGKVNIFVDGKPFTSLLTDNANGLKKPVLFPIYSPGGQAITRGWPFLNQGVERIDHPHHVGLWLNYEDVNGDDYWNNSNTPPKKDGKYGTIKINKDVRVVQKKNKYVQVAYEAEWIGSDGANVLTESTVYKITATKNGRIIDRTTTLIALKDAHFKDVKDGFLGLRLRRELEHPSTKAEVYTDANGVATNVPVLNNAGISGLYTNAEGLKGDDTWGKRSTWVNLTGTVGVEKINVAIFDHPKNIGYPSYWHTRGYGLFAMNPLGQEVFSNKKESLQLKLKKGQKTTFRHRIAIVDGDLSNEDLRQLEQDFAQKN